MLTDPKYKEITFKDYEKYFIEVLNKDTGMPARLIFYKQDREGITITFSWDLFIIFTRISYADILQMYEEENLDTIEVTGGEKTGEHPAVKKFKAEYLSRGIPEV